MSRPTRSRRWSIGRAPLLTISSVATPRSWPPTARTSHSPRSPAGPVCRSRGYGRYSSVPGWSFVLEAVDAPRVDIARRGSAAQHHRAGLVTRRQVLEGPASRVRGPARSGRGPRTVGGPGDLARDVGGRQLLVVGDHYAFQRADPAMLSSTARSVSVNMAVVHRVAGGGGGGAPGCGWW